MSHAANPFRRTLFQFLQDLADNNNRDWFQANKARFERVLKDPALQFISDFGPQLRSISRHFDAIPKATGGSLFRIYRDTRFARDKTPYKTHVGIHFRHQQAKDAHAPGFYLHLQPGESFVGVGIWRPAGPGLQAIRSAIDDRQAAWRKVRRTIEADDDFALAGDSLKRAPRGVDPEHPLIEDLKRKDFVAVASLTQTEALAADFPTTFAHRCQQAAPLARFLCRALDVPF